MARRLVLAAALIAIFGQLAIASEPAAQVKETPIDGPHGVTIKVRMEGPYDAETPLQVVCYFRHKESGDKTLGAAVELDTRLGGVIASLRNGGEFTGDELETLLLTSPKDTIKPKQLLLIGVGNEDSLSLATLERVGKVALREAAILGARRVAFAPLLRDQGNSKFDVGEVERAVIRGVLLAYDTEKRLQKEGLAMAFTLEEWIAEAGPTYFDDTRPGLRKGIDDAKAEIGKRSSSGYASRK